MTILISSPIKIILSIKSSNSYLKINIYILSKLFYILFILNLKYIIGFNQIFSEYQKLKEKKRNMLNSILL